MNDASQFAKDKLQAASRAKDKARQLALGLSLVATGCVLVLGVALLDYWLLLPKGVRFAGLTVLAVIIGAGVRRLWVARRQPTALKEAALDAEAGRPELGCELSTAAEYLSGERQVTQEYERDLAAALQAKAASNLQTATPSYWKKPVQPAVLLGTVTFASLIFIVLASGAFTAFKRAALPWSTAAYTKVQVKPGNFEIPIGRDVEIKSVFSGRVPREARFEWQDEGSPTWQYASLSRNERGEYNYPVKNIRTSMKYRVTGSDAVSADYTVEAYTPPEVKEWRVALNYPDYTKRRPTLQNSPEISVLRGSTATIVIAPSVKLSKARLKFKDQPALELQRAENGLWQASLKITKDTEYQIELADEKGRANDAQATHHIRALADAAPKVEITEPGEDMRADATNTIPVKIAATDDFGIQELRLVYHKLGGPEQVVTAARRGETNAELTADIPLAALNLKDHELVAYHAEAKDNNTLDGPSIGKSEVFFIEITNQEGGEPKSKKGTPGEKANLLVIQKQIVADTTALAAKDAPEKFQEMAKRQADAIEFGKLYLEGLGAGLAAATASLEMQAAVKDMEQARARLEKNDRAGALPAEESALAHLYQVIKQAPELENLPTVPQLAKKDKKQPPKKPALQVVLDAIKKKKKEQPENQDLAAALEEAKDLLEEQAGLTIGAQNPGSGEGEGEVLMDRSPKDSKPAQAKKGPGKGKSAAKKSDGKQAMAKPAGKGEGKGQGQGQGEGQGRGEGKGKGQGKGEGKGEGQGKGDGKGEGKGKGEGQGQGEGDDKDADPKDNQELAKKEEELSKQTDALAEKLARMSGKDARLGHGVAKKLKDAAAKMSEASKEFAQGNNKAGGSKGAQGVDSLGSAVAELERILNQRAELTDVSKEDFPKQYEAVIADYLKKLSYEE